MHSIFNRQVRGPSGDPFAPGDEEGVNSATSPLRVSGHLTTPGTPGILQVLGYLYTHRQKFEVKQIKLYGKNIVTIETFWKKKFQMRYHMMGFNHS